MNVELSQDDVQNIINAYDKDIKKMEEQEKEIARLNNIINELEKDIRIQLSQGGPREIRDLVDGYDILNKLKELKGE